MNQADKTAIVDKLKVDIYRPLAADEKLKDMSWYRNGVRFAISLIESLPIEGHQDAIAATAAFQRLPDELAKALNYGATMAEDDWNRLAQLWNTHMEIDTLKGQSND